MSITKTIIKVIIMMMTAFFLCFAITFFVLFNLLSRSSLTTILCSIFYFIICLPCNFYFLFYSIIKIMFLHYFIFSFLLFSILFLFPDKSEDSAINRELKGSNYIFIFISIVRSIISIKFIHFVFICFCFYLNSFFILF